MSSFITRLKITLGKTNADEEGLSALYTDADVIVSEGKDIVFEPAGTAAHTGVIFYPGGRCDPRAYAPIARALAQSGYLTVIPSMPLRLAVMDANRAEKIMSAHPRITHWVIGGHSMGGVMAGHFASKRQNDFAGLFFAGSYPAKMSAMPNGTLPAVMISGSQDSFTRQDEVDAAPERLPASTRFVMIEGGDHYQFGYFDKAPHTATISRAEQQQQLVNELITFISQLS